MSWHVLSTKPEVYFNTLNFIGGGVFVIFAVMYNNFKEKFCHKVSKVLKRSTPDLQLFLQVALEPRGCHEKHFKWKISTVWYDTDFLC